MMLLGYEAILNRHNRVERLERGGKTLYPYQYDAFLEADWNKGGELTPAELARAVKAGRVRLEPLHQHVD